MSVRAGALGLALATLLVGCGGNGDGGDVGDVGRDDARSDVEQLIRSQRPDSVERNTGRAVYVSEVTCVAEDDEGRRFDCVATVGGATGAGLEYVDLGITATCDEAKCTWRTE